MSEQLPEKSHELAQVLSRISALMRHGEPAAEASVLGKQIPLLTEVYEGEPPAYTSRNPQELPTLDLMARSSEDAVEAISAEVVEMLLVEMMPLIRTAVKKAVQLELANAEQSLSTQLEAELVQSLRERLQSDLP